MKVFYNPNQSVAGNLSFSPSAGKPERVVQSWKDLGIPLKIMDFEPLTEKQISQAHDGNYVRGIVNGAECNGFGNRSLEVARSLLWTTGSFAAAAMDAIESGGVSVSPTSGFHHAGYDRASAFCTFNGLAVAAQLVRHRHGGRVGILDLDMHYGNGTDDIIAKLSLDYINHWTLGAGEYKADDDPDGWVAIPAREFIDDLPGMIRREFANCDVLFYQAGADPHVDDPLGGVLTTEQLRIRDEIVFTVCRELELPVAWNLAGGYQKPFEKVLKIHDNTALECIRVHG